MLMEIFLNTERKSFELKNIRILVDGVEVALVIDARREGGREGEGLC